MNFCIQKKSLHFSVKLILSAICALFGNKLKVNATVINAQVSG